MCMIEELGYSIEKRELHCNNCIIISSIGKCEYLKDLESKIATEGRKVEIQK